MTDNERAALADDCLKAFKSENISLKDITLQKAHDALRAASNAGEAIVEKCARAVELQDVENAAYLAGVVRALSRPLSKGRAETDPLADLVARFSAALLEKLRAAEAKGRSGWDYPNWKRECVEGLHRHANKGDPRDVAAYAAFCWHHGWSTTPSPVPSSGEVATSLSLDDLLILLVEECSEVTKAATKCLRFGFDVDHGVEYGNNRVVLSQEVGDLLAIIDALPLEPVNLEGTRSVKIAKAEAAKAKYGRSLASPETGE